jgi:tRNA threonylcarbamoyl adenosine modification protein (Sua5/YciO/YrdC/YwlC family)
VILEVDSHFPQPGIVEHAIEILKESNGLIAYPTDTIYGLGCDAHNPKAVDALIKLKGDRTGKNFSILVDTLTMLEKYAVINDAQRKILKEHLPGPFTFVLHASKKTPAYLVSEKGTIGIRIPRNRLCRALVKELGKPLITTSLNFSGKPVVTDPEKMPKKLKEGIAVILDAEKIEGLGSTVVDLTGKKPKILRKGQGKLST